MIHLNDLRIGNWISLNMPGSLIAAHIILDMNESGVSIAHGTEYSFFKIDVSGMNQKQLKIESLPPRDIKGIPLSADILASCGFQLQSLKQEQSGKNYYSLGDFTVISSCAKPRCTFTDESGNLSFQFVHELQNLYFEVMNKELDITIAPFNFQMLS
ncbi:MAG: hypothetical protein M3Z26_09275 [Bacteroidota bacterium]|nr:hypothetical protein [Bacteroidota bacterium]